LDFTVERHCIELVEVAQRPVELAFQHRPKVDRANYAVVELDPESLRLVKSTANELEGTIAKIPTSS